MPAPPLPLTAHCVDGWQGAERQVTVCLIGSKCFSTEEVFPPQRSYKELFQRKEGRQSVWPPCSLPRVNPGLSLLDETLAEVGGGMQSSEAPCLGLPHRRTFLSSGVMVKPRFLSVAPGTPQL